MACTITQSIITKVLLQTLFCPYLPLTVYGKKIGIWVLVSVRCNRHSNWDHRLWSQAAWVQIPAMLLKWLLCNYLPSPPLWQNNGPSLTGLWQILDEAACMKSLEHCLAYRRSSAKWGDCTYIHFLAYHLSLCARYLQVGKMSDSLRSQRC